MAHLTSILTLCDALQAIIERGDVRLEKLRKEWSDRRTFLQKQNRELSQFLDLAREAAEALSNMSQSGLVQGFSSPTAAMR